MAYTAGTGYRFYRDVRGNTSSPTPIQLRIANSTTLRIGDLVRVNTAGLVVGAGAGNPIAGVLAGFVDNSGINPFSLGYSGAGATLTGDDTLATASDNSSRAKYIVAEVLVDIAGEYLFLADADDSLAQTNLFQFIDTDANNRQPAIGTVSDASAQLQIVALDPEATGGKTADASKCLVRIAENQFGMTLDAATSKIVA